MGEPTGLDGQAPTQNSVEQGERLPAKRLETYLYFVRHGKAESLPDSDTIDAIDAIRSHTAAGTADVEKAGIKIADELGDLSNIVVVARNSKRLRSGETSTGVVEQLKARFIEQGHDAASVAEHFQTTVNPVRDSLNFGNDIQAYTAGGERRGDKTAPPGDKRRSNTTGLSEEWARDPAQLQADIEASGVGGNAEEIVNTMKSEIRQSVAVVDTASRWLARKWAGNNPGTEATPPRFVVIEGSHGFVTEPWLTDVVADYEAEHGAVRIELKYAEYWRMHWSANPQEQPTLSIAGHEIPVKPEFMARLSQAAPNPDTTPAGPKEVSDGIQQ